MPQNFLPCDRDQEFLLAPSPREWLPEDHLAWFVIEAVEALDLKPFYADYRADGHGRSGTLALGSTKIHANASGQVNMTYEQLAEAILDEAAEIDAREDELYGERRGDELPEHLRTTRKRREWLEQARRELQAEQAQRPKASSRAERLGEARRRLEDEHALERQATLAYQAGRAERRRALAEQGLRPSGRPRAQPLVVPDTPAGRVNLTDPDSRPVKTPRGFIQGYNAQAAATADQIVVMADVVRRGSIDFGDLNWERKPYDFLRRLETVHTRQPAVQGRAAATPDCARIPGARDRRTARLRGGSQRSSPGSAFGSARQHGAKNLTTSFP